MGGGRGERDWDGGIKAITWDLNSQVYRYTVQVYRCTVYSNMRHEFTSMIQAAEYLRFAPGVNILLESGRKIGVLSQKNKKVSNSAKNLKWQILTFFRLFSAQNAYFFQFKTHIFLCRRMFTPNNVHPSRCYLLVRDCMRALVAPREKQSTFCEVIQPSPRPGWPVHVNRWHYSGHWRNYVKTDS